MSGDGIPGASRGVCDVLVHDGGDGVVPQLLGVQRNDGGNAGDALSQEPGHHGRLADAGVQRAGKMGVAATRQFVKNSMGRAAGAKSCAVEYVGMVVSGRATAAMDDGPGV